LLLKTISRVAVKDNQQSSQDQERKTVALDAQGGDRESLYVKRRKCNEKEYSALSR
jgi:hypothetical protein